MHKGEVGSTDTPLEGFPIWGIACNIKIQLRLCTQHASIFQLQLTPWFYSYLDSYFWLPTSHVIPTPSDAQIRTSKEPEHRRNIIRYSYTHKPDSNAFFLFYCWSQVAGIPGPGAAYPLAFITTRKLRNTASSYCICCPIRVMTVNMTKPAKSQEIVDSNTR